MLGFLGLSGTKLYVFLGLVLAVILMTAANAVLVSRIQVKAAKIDSLSDQLEIAAGDAKRWQDAAAQRQGVIDRQAATLRRMESDGVAARAIADRQADQAAMKIATLNATISTLKEKAHARPEDVRPLGPIVRDALQSGAVGGLRH